MFIFAKFVLLRDPRSPIGKTEILSGGLLFVHNLFYVSGNLDGGLKESLIHGGIATFFCAVVYIKFLKRARQQLASLDAEAIKKHCLQTLPNATICLFITTLFFWSESGGCLSEAKHARLCYDKIDATRLLNIAIFALMTTRVAILPFVPQGYTLTNIATLRVTFAETVSILLGVAMAALTLRFYGQSREIGECEYDLVWLDKMSISMKRRSRIHRYELRTIYITIISAYMFSLIAHNWKEPAFLSRVMMRLRTPSGSKGGENKRPKVASPLL